MKTIDFMKGVRLAEARTHLVLVKGSKKTKHLVEDLTFFDGAYGEVAYVIKGQKHDERSYDKVMSQFAQGMAKEINKRLMAAKIKIDGRKVEQLMGEGDEIFMFPDKSQLAQTEITFGDRKARSGQGMQVGPKMGNKPHFYPNVNNFIRGQVPDVIDEVIANLFYNLNNYLPKRDFDRVADLIQKGKLDSMFDKLDLDKDEIMDNLDIEVEDEIKGAPSTKTTEPGRTSYSKSTLERNEEFYLRYLEIDGIDFSYDADYGLVGDMSSATQGKNPTIAFTMNNKLSFLYCAFELGDYHTDGQLPDKITSSKGLFSPGKKLFLHGKVVPDPMKKLKKIDLFRLSGVSGGGDKDPEFKLYRPEYDYEIKWDDRVGFWAIRFRFESTFYHPFGVGGFQSVLSEAKKLGFKEANPGGYAKPNPLKENHVPKQGNYTGPRNYITGE